MTHPDPGRPPGLERPAAPARGRRLVLASGSPRRRQLLAQLGLQLTVRPPDIDETPRPGEAGPAYVERLARAKATDRVDVDELVVAADTTVDLDGDLLGKPASPAAARRLLQRLSGRDHLVHTGVAVAASDGRGAPSVRSAVATTVVTFAELPEAWIDWYVATDEPYDKAGGYAVQGAAGLFVSRIEGSPTNVVGLPLATVAALLAETGLDLFTFAD